MGAITVRNISPATHQALKLRAASNGRSTEAEIRAILDEAIRRPPGRDLGAVLAEYGRRVGGVEFEVTRDQTPAKPATFE